MVGDDDVAEIFDSFFDDLFFGRVLGGGIRERGDED